MTSMSNFSLIDGWDSSDRGQMIPIDLEQVLGFDYVNYRRRNVRVSGVLNGSGIDAPIDHGRRVYIVWFFVQKIAIR